MKNFLLSLNAKGLVNLTGAEYKDAKHNDDAVISLNMDLEADSSRVLDFNGHFVAYTHSRGIVVGKDKILFEDGSLEKLKDVFSNFKADTRKILPQVGDFIEVRNCEIGNVFVACNMAVWKKDVKTTKGLVTDIRGGLFGIVIDGKSFTVPSIALKKVPKTIMSKTMRDIYIYLMNKGRKPIISPEYNYMDISDDGKFIEYIANDRLSRFENGDFWNRELRAKFATKKKIRGVLRALFNCSNDDMDAAIMIYGKINLEVEVLEGAEIYQVFDSDNNPDCGTLGESCMINKDSEYFEIYENNAKCAIVRDDDGMIILRAMIWELHSNKKRNKIQLLDRIYSENDSFVPLLQNWAAKNGMYVLPKQTFSQKKMINPKGVEVEIGDYHVRLDRADYGKYPYIDTMCFKVGDRLYSAGYVKVAHKTDGSLESI